ncbi:MAG: hypothetical protein WC845_04035 [Candidatus Staskawiczbacteria bacterium]|jgi:hypothetical protein
MQKFYDNIEINEIANEVIKYMPTMKAYFASNESLSEYSKRINSYMPNPVHLERQSFFRQKLLEKVNRIFNEKEKENIDLRINNDWGVVGGIVEHHGILDHPLLLSVSLVSNFYKLLERKEYGDALVFATGNIPLNEPFRRRGFMLNGKKFNLYPKSYKNKVVYGLGKYDFDLKRKIVEAHEWHLLTKEEQGFLENINGIIKGIDFSTCDTIGDQFTKINYYLWPLLFEEKLRGNSANLISVEYDDIIIDYMIHVLTTDKESHVYKMLFDKDFRNLILKEFEGKQGAWDQDSESGTHFFWALDEDNERVRLELKNDTLVGKGIQIKLNPDDIIANLKEKKILPGMLLKFSLTVFYMGMKPLMGYSLEYMSRLKEKMIGILEKYFPEEAERSRNIPYDNMNLISICKGKGSEGKPKDLHAFDVFFKGGFAKSYLEKLDKFQFKDFMIPSLLFAYNYSVNKFGKQEEKKTFNISEEELQKPFYRLFD